MIIPPDIAEALDTLPVGILTITADLSPTIVHVNRPMRQWLRLSLANCVGQRLLDRVAPHDRERTAAAWSQIVSGQHDNGWVGLRNEYICGDGTTEELTWLVNTSALVSTRLGLFHACCVQGKVIAV